MNPHTQRRADLRTIMTHHKLSPGEVAQACCVAVPTVHSWLRPSSSRAARTMPDNALKLLQLAIKGS